MRGESRLRDGMNIMAKVLFNHLIDRVQGKLCNDPKSPIFAHRNDSGSNYVYHRDNPYTGPLSEAQKANQQRFATAQAETKTIMNSLEQLAPYKDAFAKQNKYATLRGYIFAQVYKNA